MSCSAREGLTLSGQIQLTTNWQTFRVFQRKQSLKFHGNCLLRVEGQTRLCVCVCVCVCKEKKMWITIIIPTVDYFTGKLILKIPFSNFQSLRSLLVIPNTCLITYLLVSEAVDLQEQKLWEINMLCCQLKMPCLTLVTGVKSCINIILPINIYITKTCLYNFDPLKPHFYIVKLGFTGVYIIFLISAQKHRLWVLVRTASSRQL